MIVVSKLLLRKKPVGLILLITQQKILLMFDIY